MKNGFTLLELSLVLFMISLVIGIPLFTYSIKTYQDDERKTYQLLILAQQLAKTASIRTKITHDDAMTWVLTQDETLIMSLPMQSPLSHTQWVGFTHHGWTRRAGTLSIHDIPRFTVGVGYGRIRKR